MKTLIENVVEQLRILLPNDKVEAKEIQKNNGVILNGIIITPENNIIAPTIYIDQMIQEGMSADTIVENVIHIYNANERNTISNLIPAISSFEQTEHLLTLRLINTSFNEELLKDIPYREFLDLAIIVVAEFTLNDGTEASFKVSNNILTNWGVSFDIVYEKAYNNFVNKKDTKLLNITDILKSFASAELIDTIPPEAPLMFVLTSGNNLNGAVKIIDKNIIEEFSNRFIKDILIIPSSIHEIILMPIVDYMEIQNMAAMVKEVNASSVSKEEWLSDHIYIYSREIGQIESIIE